MGSDDMTRANDIKTGMKFDNYDSTIEVVEVRKVDGGVVVLWNGTFGNEFVASDDGIYLKRVA